MVLIALDLFPELPWDADKKHLARRMSLSDERFKNISRDYWQCLEALRYWQLVDSNQAEARRQEYAALIWEIESEMTEYLARHEQRQQA